MEFESSVYQLLFIINKYSIMFSWIMEMLLEVKGKRNSNDKLNTAGSNLTQISQYSWILKYQLSSAWREICSEWLLLLLDENG